MATPGSQNPTPRGENQAAPNPGALATQVAGAMVVKEPIPPLGYAITRDANGRALMLVAVVMGSENCDKFAASLEKIRPHMQPVDTFDGTPGEPERRQ